MIRFVGDAGAFEDGNPRITPRRQIVLVWGEGQLVHSFPTRIPVIEELVRDQRPIQAVLRMRSI